MKNQWFVIHTLSGQEQKVKDTLEKRLKIEEMEEYILEILVPMEKVVEIRNGKKTASNRKLYPGYVFIKMILLDDQQRIIDRPWYFIRETRFPDKIPGAINDSLLVVQQNHFDENITGIKLSI